ncbi:unnamed protein product [Nesidiocoris tenuis]|uniref:E3 ubiquitin-protein ligase listerin n=1 Tax=Nesidiocoris tenuis TaxID=355587 RepID=A0A6H5GFV0_9HEMI|nr:unnamed protein product [Nesidiocoris tenuis]
MYSLVVASVELNGDSTNIALIPVTCALDENWKTLFERIQRLVTEADYVKGNILRQDACSIPYRDALSEGKWDPLADLDLGKFARTLAFCVKYLSHGYGAEVSEDLEISEYDAPRAKISADLAPAHLLAEFSVSLFVCERSVQYFNAVFAKSWTTVVEASFCNDPSRILGSGPAGREELRLNSEIGRFVAVLIEKYPDVINEKGWDFIMISLASWFTAIPTIEIGECYLEEFISSNFLIFVDCFRANACHQYEFCGPSAPEFAVRGDLPFVQDRRRLCILCWPTEHRQIHDFVDKDDYFSPHSCTDNVVLFIDEVQTHRAVREVIAVYTVEETSTELVIKLAANHPLSPPKVEISKTIKISSNQNRQLLMQLTIFLTHQVGGGFEIFEKNCHPRVLELYWPQ